MVKDPDADGTCQEIVTRIIAELMADGVPVVALTCAGSDPACLTFSGATVSAIVLVQRRDNVRAVEVRAGEAIAPSHAGHRTATAEFEGVQRVASLESAGGAAALAVRTVELLRAMLIEVADVASATGMAAVNPVVTVARKAIPSSATAADASAPAAVEQKDDDEEEANDLPPAKDSRVIPIGPHNVTMNVGAAMIGGFTRLEAAYGPSLTVGRRTSDHVLLSVLLVGPAFGRDQRNAAGVVSIRHEMAVLGADLAGLFWNRVLLRAGVGVGVYHIHVDGQPAPLPPGPFVSGGSQTFPTGRSAGGFATTASWSAGVVANITSDLGVFLDGRIFVLTPTPVILINGLEVGRASNPGIAIMSGVELRL